MIEVYNMLRNIKYDIDVALKLIKYVTLKLFTDIYKKICLHMEQFTTKSNTCQ